MDLPSSQQGRPSDVSNLAPIVLFVYNRPEHTRRTLAALAANPLASESDLIVYADGPRKPEHAALVEAVRTVVRGISGFRSLKLIERETNLGLAKSIIAGVSTACDMFGCAIVIEDDLIVAPQFLHFMNAALERYRDSPQVHQVSGYLFPGCEGDEHIRFLPLTTTWGWATWQRAWSLFDKEASSIGRLRSDSGFRNRFDLNGAYDYSGMIESQLRGAIDSWGIRWYLSVFAQGGLTVYPGKSLVENIGFDGSGTHGAGHSTLTSRMSATHDYGVNDWPRDFTIDHECMTAIEGVLRSMSHGKTKRFGIQRLKAWLKA